MVQKKNWIQIYQEKYFWFFKKFIYKNNNSRKRNLDFYYGFISTISPESQSLRIWEEIVPKTQKDDKIYYLTIKKNKFNLFIFLYSN